MHLIDASIAWLIGIGCIVFFVRTLKQISGFILKCTKYTFILGLGLFMLLGLYRITTHLLIQYGVNLVFGINLAAVSEFLNESILIQYAMKAMDYLINFGHALIIEDIVFYFTKLLPNISGMVFNS